MIVQIMFYILVLSDRRMYSENSEIIIGLETNSRLLSSILNPFFICACL